MILDKVGKRNKLEGNWSSSFWSGTDVEVSLANPRYIWAGSSMSSAGNIFLSKDWGETYESVPNFSNLEEYWYIFTSN